MIEKNGDKLALKVNLSEVTSRLMKLIIQLSPEDKVALLRDMENRIASLRRNSERQAYIAEVDFVYNGRPSKGFIENISHTGVFILSLEKPEKGSMIVMTFIPPDGGKSVKMTGKVVRIQEEGFAIEFNEKLNKILQKYQGNINAVFDLHIK